MPTPQEKLAAIRSILAVEYDPTPHSTLASIQQILNQPDNTDDMMSNRRNRLMDNLIDLGNA